MNAIKQFRVEAWKSQDFNGVWTRDLAITERRSNQLSYDVGRWSFVSSNEPLKNGCEVIYEIAFITTMIIAYLMILIVFYRLLNQQWMQ